jgi:hypothetical protein
VVGLASQFDSEGIDVGDLQRDVGERTSYCAIDSCWDCLNLQCVQTIPCGLPSGRSLHLAFVYDTDCFAPVECGYDSIIATRRVRFENLSNAIRTGLSVQKTKNGAGV